jgi:hypothetical protein
MSELEDWGTKDLTVRSLRVLQNLDSKTTSQLQTKTIQNEQTSQFILAQLNEVSRVADQAVADAYAYNNNIPPSNNVQDLAFEVIDNADGSVDIKIEFGYLQGEVEADGFLVFYKCDLDAPEPIDMAKDPCVFVSITDLQ